MKLLLMKFNLIIKKTTKIKFNKIKWLWGNYDWWGLKKTCEFQKQKNSYEIKWYNSKWL